MDMTAFPLGHGMDPAKHVTAGTVGVFCFLSVWWLTQCKARWIPDGRSYDMAIVNLEEKLRNVLDQTSGRAPGTRSARSANLGRAGDCLHNG